MLREAFRQINGKRPFTVNAMVVLPDHLHCIWTLPFADKDYPTRWRLIKTWVTKHDKTRLKRPLVSAQQQHKSGQTGQTPFPHTRQRCMSQSYSAGTTDDR